MKRSSGTAGRRHTSLLAGLVALVAALLGAAALAGPTDQPSFLIETITVEGLRHASAGIVTAASRLQPGTAYSESELRAAVYRIERLPFVLAADFSLRKGRARGAFQLVIAVTETTTVFAGVDALSASSGLPRKWSFHSVASVGARTFVGAYSEISASVSRQDSGEGFPPAYQGQATFTHHNLFGRSAVGTLTVSHSDRAYSPGEDTANARLIMPIAGDNAVSLVASGAKWRDFLGENRALGGGADWLFDSTDDPFTPTRGVRATVGGRLESSSNQGVRVDGEPSLEIEYRGWTVSADAARFFAMSHDQGLGLWGRYGRGRTSWSKTQAGQPSNWVSTYDSAAIGVTHTWPVWRPQGRESFSRLWLESSASAVAEAYSSSPGVSRSWTSRVVASVALAGRGRWGTIRLTVLVGRGLRGTS